MRDFAQENALRAASEGKNYGLRRDMKIYSHWISCGTSITRGYQKKPSKPVAQSEKLCNQRDGDAGNDAQTVERGDDQRVFLRIFVRAQQNQQADARVGQ